MDTRNIPISKLVANNGQVDGLPKNPRQIKDKRFKALKKSIEDAPEMLNLRELIVYPHGGKFVAVCGNMRLRACRELGYKELPCKVLDEETPPEKLREYAIKDNVPFGEDDMDAFANEWDMAELEDWGMELMKDYETESEIERKEREFKERMEAGEIDETDEEYQEFIDKFKAKKTTDDCYTPKTIYDAVAQWVCDEYNVKASAFERPFYPNGDFKKYNYPKGCIVVDNPPFSILSQIVKFYTEKDIKFFLFAPALTLFSSSSQYATAISVGVTVTYENGANVSTSFLTNLDNTGCRCKSSPTLYETVRIANEEVQKSLHKELPIYSYPDNIVTAPFLARLSKYGIDFSITNKESKIIRQLDSQKESGKTIYGSGYIISEKAAAEKAAAEKAAAEKAAAEKAAATRWSLSEREKNIIKQLSENH